MDDCELLAYFRRGLIPGPQESEEAFIERVQEAVVQDHLAWQEVASTTLSTLGFAVDWVPLLYSSQGLSWWEGAVTWIGNDSLPQIQLRPVFQKSSFLGYHQEDILTHEAVHAARMCFEEPKFEEMLAYQTARHGWKRLIGPAFQRSWDPIVLLCSLLLGIYQIWIPVLFIGGVLFRLLRRRFQLSRCLRRFSLPAVLCMTDAEIIKMQIDENDPLRSRLICLLKKSISK